MIAARRLPSGGKTDFGEWATLIYSLGKLQQQLLDIGSSRTIMRMDELIEARKSSTDHKLDGVVLRCDIERDLQHTLKFARWLHDNSIPASMYFHTRTETYNPAVFRELRRLGHEVGYHHECLDRNNGNFEQARKLFVSEVGNFQRDGNPLRSVCAHGESGLPKVGYSTNWDLFKRYPELISSLGIGAEVYKLHEDGVFNTSFSDTFSGYLSMQKKMQELAAGGGMSQVLIHPHRWRNHGYRSLLEMGRDLKQAVRNRRIGSRIWETIH